METNENISGIIQLFQQFNVQTFSESTDILDIIGTVIEKEYPDDAFFIIDLTKVIDQYNRWILNLPKVKPFYAIKCNPNDMIIRTLNLLGTGFDCASKNEIRQVLDLGVAPDDVIFANPTKSDDHLAFSRAKDVDLITFDSEDELFKIKLYHPKAELILRIKVDDSKSICKFSSKFGLDTEELDGVFKIAKFAGLDIVGVSFHVGSNCGSVEQFEKAIRDSREVFDKGKSAGFTKMKILDIGGGFPGTDDGDIKFEDIAEQINKSLDKYFNEDEFPDLKIIAEPGRYFASASHTLVLRVIAKKMFMDKETKEPIYKYTLNDGVYGSFNCIQFDHAKPIILPYNERGGETFKCIVYGPTCDSVDTISNDCRLPDLAISERVYVQNFGAYTTAAASNFNGFQKTPCVYVYRCHNDSTKV
jgi:ornithine decarboxylase